MTPLYALFLLQSQGGGGLAQLLILLPFIAVIYFMMYLPQKKRQAKWQEMLGQLKPGDKVTTSGGLFGTILSMKGADGAADGGTLILRLPPDNIKLEVSRSSIVSVRTDDEKA